MRKLGARTVSLLVLVTTLIVLAVTNNWFKTDRLQSLTHEARFFIGLFSVLASYGIFRFSKLHDRSEHYFRISRISKAQENEVLFLSLGFLHFFAGTSSDGKVIEIPKILSALLTFVACFIVAISSFDSRAISVMLDLPSKLQKADAQFCQVEEIKPEAQARPQIEAQIPGCELVYRAYELGISKDLGSCQPTVTAKPLELCTLRQLDEPFLHYMTRQLTMYVKSVPKFLNAKSELLKRREIFKRQTDNLKLFSEDIKHVVKSSPKASHHLFTNLPSPQGKRSTTFCLDISEDNSQSANLMMGHVSKEMLFNAKYDEVAGFCEEYTVHWQSPLDSCDQISQDAARFLVAQGAMDQINLVLNRVQQEWELKRFTLQLNSFKTGRPLPPPPPPSVIEAMNIKPRATAVPETVISFQCLMEDDKIQRQTIARTLGVNAFGKNYQAREVRFSPKTSAQRIHLDMYRYFAQTMVDNFKPVGITSHNKRGISEQWQVGPENFNSAELPFTQLEFLKGANIFTGSDRLQERSDLLEIYPYYHHLYHFIELFRQQYRMQKARL